MPNFWVYGDFSWEDIIHQKQNTSQTCTALISCHIEKVCQESLVYQEKLFVNKLPSLTMSRPWNLPAKWEILGRRLHLKQRPERKTASSWVHVHDAVFHIGGIFRNTCSVHGRFLHDLKHHIETQWFYIRYDNSKMSGKEQSPRETITCLQGLGSRYVKALLWVWWAILPLDHQDIEYQ